LPAGLEIRDWTVDHASYFRAIRIEKTMVAVILMLIVAVAAFYLVAMLAMVVTDKRTDIAILRTSALRRAGSWRFSSSRAASSRGSESRSGVVLGSLLGHYAGEAAAFLERLFRFEIFSSEVYTVTRIPSELRGTQILWIAGHRHVHHAARHYLPGLPRVAHTAGRRAAVRVGHEPALRMAHRYALPALRASQRLRVVRSRRCR
jgi:ABC-type lipoprotein release transport system permease subunit